jgi:hypothetical protein
MDGKIAEKASRIFGVVMRASSFDSMSYGHR